MARKKRGKTGIIRLILLVFSGAATRHVTCISVDVNEDCGLAAPMQALAAASRKLNCFAALLGSSS
jgi:hypothetical protein